MRHLLTATFAATLLGAVGCVEPIDQSTTNPTLPKTNGELQFDSDVSPMLEQVCAGCHTGAPESTPTKFLGMAGQADNYAKVTFDDGVIGGWNPALAGLLTKGEHADGTARAWTGSAVRLLDQTKLPTQTEFVEITTERQMHDAIRRLVVRGAPAIGVAAAFGVYLGVREVTDWKSWLERLNGVCSFLATSRPTAVNLFWAIERIKRVAGNRPPRGTPVQVLRIVKQRIEFRSRFKY